MPQNDTSTAVQDYGSVHVTVVVEEPTPPVAENGNHEHLPPNLDELKAIATVYAATVLRPDLKHLIDRTKSADVERVRRHHDPEADDVSLDDKIKAMQKKGNSALIITTTVETSFTFDGQTWSITIKVAVDYSVKESDLKQAIQPLVAAMTQYLVYEITHRDASQAQHQRYVSTGRLDREDELRNTIGSMTLSGSGFRKRLGY